MGGCLKTVGAATLIVLGLFVVIAVLTSGPPNVTTRQIYAKMAVESAIDQLLKAPSTADYTLTRAAVTDRDIWILEGHVDAANSFGAKIRSPFTARVQEVCKAAERHCYRLFRLIFDGKLLVDRAIAGVAKSPGTKPNALVKNVQAALRDRGYQPGTADGVLGAKTKAAIKAFRADQGLPPGDKVDADLLDALSISNL